MIYQIEGTEKFLTVYPEVHGDGTTMEIIDTEDQLIVRSTIFPDGVRKSGCLDDWHPFKRDFRNKEEYAKLAELDGNCPVVRRVSNGDIGEYDADNIVIKRSYEWAQGRFDKPSTQVDCWVLVGGE